MKTFAAILAVMMLMTSLIACGGGEPEATQETQRVTEWALHVNGKELFVGMDTVITRCDGVVAAHDANVVIRVNSVISRVNLIFATIY